MKNDLTWNKIGKSKPFFFPENQGNSCKPRISLKHMWKQRV